MSIHLPYAGRVAPNVRGGLLAAPGLLDVIQGLELGRTQCKGMSGCWQPLVYMMCSRGWNYDAPGVHSVCFRGDFAIKTVVGFLR